MLPFARIGYSPVTSVVDEIGRLATCTDPAYLKLLELTNQLVDLTRETMATEGWESVKNSLREAGSPSHHFYLI